MDKELQKRKTEQKEKDPSMNMILFSSLAIMILFLIELFLMIVMPQMLPAIAAVGVVIAGCTYVDLSTCIKHLRKKEQEQDEQYASILKSEKASYLLIRKYFDEIEEQLNLMEDKFSNPFQEVIAAQKATAKVTISRNKENTDALMNSNDKLLELVFNLESKIEELSNSLSGDLEERAKSQNAALMQKQTEMSNQMRELELSLRNEILQAVNKLSTVSPQVVMAPPQMMQMQQPVAAPANIGLEPISAPEMTAELGELGSLEDIPDMMPLDAMADMEESVIPESEPMAVPEEELDPVARIESEEAPSLMSDLDLSDPNKAMSPDDIAALLASMAADTESASLLPDAEVIEDEVEEPEPIAEPEPIMEAVTEELPPMPDLSDPNKMMSPDDIAALLANMTAEASVVADEVVEEEVVEEPEPEPIPEPEPVFEGMSSVPDLDLSDPNKMMSPDDIAALLASMSADVENASLLPDVEQEEEEPVVEPEEEKPPMPDLSDPNRQMSPEEIAALFANMG